jgi:hypothetical protein
VLTTPSCLHGPGGSTIEKSCGIERPRERAPPGRREEDPPPTTLRKRGWSDSFTFARRIYLFKELRLLFVSFSCCYNSG